MSNKILYRYTNAYKILISCNVSVSECLCIFATEFRKAGFYTYNNKTCFLYFNYSHTCKLTLLVNMDNWL